MIKLYQFPAIWGLPSGSSFCVKVEAWLRLAGLPYQIQSESNPTRAPKGKLPYIVDDDRTIADSGFILADLEQRYHTRVDEGLSPLSVAQAHAFRRLIEESLYFAILYSRFVDPAGWPITREAFFGTLTGPLAFVVPRMVRNDVRRSIHGQGLGRHTAEEVYALGASDLAALATALGDRPCFLDDRPRSIDATLWGHLIQILWAPHPTPLKSALESFPNLVAYCVRMRDAVFPECQAGR